MSSIYGTSLLNNYGLSSLYGNSILGNSQTSNNSLNSIFSMMLLSMLGQSSSSNSLFGNYSNNSNGSSNFLNLFQSLLGHSGKTPVTVDEETVTVTPKEKVYIVGSYATAGQNVGTTGHNGGLTLEDNINDFSGNDSGGAFMGYAGMASARAAIDVQRGGTSDASNDAEFQELLSKMSESDKKLPTDKGQAYIISESGKVLGTVSSAQLGDKNKLSFWASAPTASNNSSFQVVGGSLGLEDGGTNNLKSWSSNQESNGGKIEFNGSRYEVASTILRKHSPLTFDLNGDGVKTSDKTTEFDINGDGKKDKINDIADGTLCIRGGKSGLDLFGDNTDIDGDGKADGFTDGFEALKALATKEGLINGKDDMVLDANDLKKLEEKYGLAMKTDGYNSEAKSLAEIGLTEIDLSKENSTTSTENFDGQDNLLMNQNGATFKLNGKTRDYADVWHAVK